MQKYFMPDLQVDRQIDPFQRNNNLTKLPEYEIVIFPEENKLLKIIWYKFIRKTKKTTIGV